VMIIAQFILAKAIIPAQKIQSQSASVRLSWGAWSKRWCCTSSGHESSRGDWGLAHIYKLHPSWPRCIQWGCPYKARVVASWYGTRWLGEYIPWRWHGNLKTFYPKAFHHGWGKQHNMWGWNSWLGEGMRGTKGLGGLYGGTRRGMILPESISNPLLSSVTYADALQ
jgi:hypothetical protein